MVETRTTEDTSKPSYVSTVAEDVPKIKLSKDSLSETSSINHPKKIYKKTELSNFTSFPNCTSKCNTV